MRECEDKRVMPLTLQKQLSRTIADRPNERQILRWPECALKKKPLPLQVMNHEFLEMGHSIEVLPGGLYRMGHPTGLAVARYS